MNFDNYTIKSQQALQQALQIAHEFEHQQIECEHIFLGMKAIDDNVLPFLLKQLKLNPIALEQVAKKEIDRYPKVRGGQQTLSAVAAKTLNEAVVISKKSGGDFVSIEDLFLAIFKTKNSISKVLKDQGITWKLLSLF